MGAESQVAYEAIICAVGASVAAARACRRQQDSQVFSPFHMQHLEYLTCLCANLPLSKAFGLGTAELRVVPMTRSVVPDPAGFPVQIAADLGAVLDVVAHAVVVGAGVAAEGVELRMTTSKTGFPSRS